MTDSESRKMEEKAESVPNGGDDEERRLRERLKARAAAERQPRRDERSEDRRSEDRFRRDGRSRSHEGRRENHRRGGGGGGPPSRRRYPPPSRYREQGRYHPYHRGGSSERAPRRYSNEEEEDDFGRRRRVPASPPRGRPRSHSGSSRSYSSGDRGRSRARSSGGGGSRSSRRNRSRSRSVSSHSYSSYSSSDSSHSSSSASSVSSAEDEAARKEQDKQAELYSKDQRTVFVQQLVQRTTERDLKKFFRKKELKVNEVILLRDKRTGRHKGSAYVEMRRMEDVPKAVTLSNQVPSFQRFPILVKASEAEKNYLSQGAAATNVPLTAAQVAQSGSLPVTTNLVAKPPPLVGPNGKLLEAQKVYVGSLDPSVTQEHLFLLYSQFGYLDKVALQIDTSTGMSKGFAFLSYHDPKDAFLGIQTMSGQVLAGRPMKTGWAVNQIPSIPGSEIVTSDEFPGDASNRTTNAYRVLRQLTMGVGLAQIRQGLMTETPAGAAPASGATASRVPTVADARASLAATAAAATVPTIPIPSAASTPATATVPAPATDFKQVGRSENPSPYILVHNMYDKDEETEPDWEVEIKEEFEEECSQYGKILNVKVMSKEPGGKIYASFEKVDGAQKCASSIAGYVKKETDAAFSAAETLYTHSFVSVSLLLCRRWFNRRQLRVEFVSKEEIPA